MPTLRFTYSGVERLVDNPSLIKPGQICGLEVMKGGQATEQVKRYWVDKMEHLSFPGIGVPGPAAPGETADGASAAGAPTGDESEHAHTARVPRGNGFATKKEEWY